MHVCIMRIFSCAFPLTLQNLLRKLLRKVKTAQHFRLVTSHSAWYEVPIWIAAPNRVRYSPLRTLATVGMSSGTISVS